MKKKSLLIAAASVAIVAIMSVGGTLAYFSDSQTQSNVFTMGKVEISLSETSSDDNATITEDGLLFDDLFPGDTVDKEPVITVDPESDDCYLRIKIEMSTETTTADQWPAEMQPTINTANYDWVLHSDGYYYYEDADGNLIKASKGDKIPVFTTVKLSNKWDHTVVGESFNIKITAYAVQADNFDGSADAWAKAFK